MNNKFDIIIIGAGLAGLTAGATLAKAGKKVLVLEQHNIVGGCATIFKRKGLKIEVGLHKMDWPPEHKSIKHPIFKHLGIYDRVKFVHTDSLWSIKADGLDITIPYGYENVINVLSEKFPEDKEGIKKYFAMIDEYLSSSSRLPYNMNLLQFFASLVKVIPSKIKAKKRQDKVGPILDSLIKNDKLKRILDVNLSYYHDNPYEFSWWYHSVGQAAYYNGTVFVKGGSQELSNALRDIILENGGEVKTLCNVKQITTEGNKATGVVYHDKRAKQDVVAYANKIISNASPTVTYNEILSDKTNLKEEKYDKLENSLSLFSIYLIFKNKFTEVYPDSKYSTFFTTTYNEKFSEKSKGLKSVNIYDRDMSLTNYDALDSGLVEEGDNRSVGVLCGSAYLDEWENLSPEEYKEKKEIFAQKMIDRLEQYFPNVRDNIEYYEVATAKTMKRYVKTPEGTLYGFKQNGFLKGDRADLKSKTIKNLYFCGAWGFPGGGFTGVIVNGYLVAKNILFPIPLYMTLRILTCIGLSAGVIALLLKLFI